MMSMHGNAFTALLVLPFLMVGPAGPAAQAQSCAAAAAAVVNTVSLPGAPFAALPTRDGCAIFVSLNLQQDRTTPGHITVLRRTAGTVQLVRDIPVPSQGGVAGMALSHDEKWLAVSNGRGVLLFDAKGLLAQDSKPVAEAIDAAGTGRQGFVGSVYAAISPDDTLLFVSDERTAAITVYNLARLSGGDTRALGRIAVGNAPVGLAFSPDGRRLYTTSEVAQPGGAPDTCAGEGGRGGTTAQGLLTVVDVARAAHVRPAPFSPTYPAGAIRCAWRYPRMVRAPSSRLAAPIPC